MRITASFPDRLSKERKPAMKGLIIYITAILLCLCLLAGCGSQQKADESSAADSYQQVSQEEVTQKDSSEASSSEEPTEPREPTRYPSSMECLTNL